MRRIATQKLAVHRVMLHFVAVHSRSGAVSWGAGSPHIIGANATQQIHTNSQNLPDLPEMSRVMAQIISGPDAQKQPCCCEAWISA